MSVDNRPYGWFVVLQELANELLFSRTSYVMTFVRGERSESNARVRTDMRNDEHQ